MILVLVFMFGDFGFGVLLVILVFVFVNLIFGLAILVQCSFDDCILHFRLATVGNCSLQFCSLGDF